ncbi:MAG: hypothetical protein ABIZ81_04345, partial [Opitutaceae bacterium]
YAVAVFFITLFLVLLTEAEHPVTLGFTVERLLSTLAGGALALMAALFFWPVWERDRFPPILARGLRANREFLQLLMARLRVGGPYDEETIDAKRRAEGANSALFSSLQRMTGDPKNRREGLEQAATLANGNQRLTRALTVMTLHLTPGAALAVPQLTQFADLGGQALEEVAETVERGSPDRAALKALSTALQNFRPPLPSPDSPSVDAQRQRWIFGLVIRAATELSALLLAVQEVAAPLFEETLSATPAGKT